MTLVYHLRRAGVEGRHRIFSGSFHNIAGRQADAAGLMRDVGVAAEIVRIVVIGYEGEPSWVRSKLEKIAQIAVGSASKAAQTDIGAVDVMIARHGLIKAW